MEPFLGEIRMFCGNFAPRGWATCDGQLMPIAQNSALFSILGTTFGGNGQTTFALPDLRGRVAVHPGQGPGLSPYVLGAQGGVESVTLNTTQMPAHTHVFAAPCSTATPDIASPENAGPANMEPNQNFSNTLNAMMAGGASQPAGGSQPHPNVQPFGCVNFIIALEGIFPSRS